MLFVWPSLYVSFVCQAIDHSYSQWLSRHPESTNDYFDSFELSLLTFWLVKVIKQYPSNNAEINVTNVLEMYLPFDFCVSGNLAILISLDKEMERCWKWNALTRSLQTVKKLHVMYFDQSPVLYRPQKSDSVLCNKKSYYLCLRINELTICVSSISWIGWCRSPVHFNFSTHN